MTVAAPVIVVRGENVPNSVADVGAMPPDGWEPLLRSCNPITTRYSHLRFYWYRAKGRWVLYDCIPECLMPDDGPPPGVPVEMWELKAYLNGKPARELGEDACIFVSDVQHEFWRLYRVYARPFWVLQGALGGHQVKFSPWQQNVLIAKGLPAEPPAIGSLPFAPMDGRVVTQLNHLNRLHQMDDSVDRLLRSGSKAAAEAEMERIQEDIRRAEAAFIESQIQPLSDMVYSLGKGRSEHADQLVQVRPGKAAEAQDAYQRYLQTGEFHMSDLTGS